MKLKISPVSVLLLVFSIFSSPTQSKEYTGKVIPPTKIQKAISISMPFQQNKTNGYSFTDSPTTILLSF